MPNSSSFQLGFSENRGEEKKNEILGLEVLGCFFFFLEDQFFFLLSDQAVEFE